MDFNGRCRATTSSYQIQTPRRIRSVCDVWTPWIGGCCDYNGGSLDWSRNDLHSRSKRRHDGHDDGNASPRGIVRSGPLTGDQVAAHTGRAVVKNPPPCMDSRVGGFFKSIDVLESDMSWSPCSNCRRTDNGRLRFAYLATFEGQERFSYRVRYCNDCFEALLTDVIHTAEVQNSAGQWIAQEENA